MGNLTGLLLLFLSLCAEANKVTCFEDKKEMLIPNTKYTLTHRGELLNGTQKFANLPLPKGFLAECLLSSSIKTDALVILSMSAKDYDKKSTFVFRISQKDSKVLWSQLLSNPAQPSPAFINDKIVAVPTLGQVVGLNPETGNIRWKFGNAETEAFDFHKISIQGTSTLVAEGTMTGAGVRTNSQYEINLFDGKLLPPKK